MATFKGYSKSSGFKASKKNLSGMDYEEAKHEKGEKIQKATNSRAKALEKAKK